ncbi:NLRP3 protein, partial [Polypterus senegalus]
MYDKENRIPIYSAYIHTNGGNGIRSNDWYIEPQLIDRRREKNMIIVSNNATEEEKESQAVSEDYTATDATRYDRGHLSPSMHHNNEESRTATFTLTNIVPQRTILNQGEWNRYETEIMQQFVNGCTTTYVIVGVIRGKNDKKTINNRVKVPSHLWTAACCVNNNNNPMRSLGYIAENDDKPVEDINLADLQRQIKGLVTCCCEKLQDLDLSNTTITPECMRTLALTVHAFKYVSLWSCGLTSGCCVALSSALSAEHSRLTQLELNDNNLQDSGVRLLCEGLRNRNCKLEKLGLNSCGLTSGCCGALSSVLSDEHSRLTELWLGGNNLEDSGVDQICDGLRSPNCKLEKLGLLSCHLTHECCEALSSVLSDEHSCLTKLELGQNNLGDSGVHLLCEPLKSTNCKLEKLSAICPKNDLRYEEVEEVTYACAAES